MTLFEAIDAYITLKRSLGAVFSSDARILRSFARALGDIAVRDIDPETTREFCRGKGAPTRWWERKDETLRGFFAWLVNRGHLPACPLPAHRPRVRRTFQPHIYSDDELQRLLDATAILQDSRFPLRHTTFRTLLLVLYGAGLRPGEGLRLRCRDVDLRERVLTISDSKFHKSRLVPIGVALTDALSAYSLERRHLPMPAGTHSAFFASHTGKPVSRGQLERVFHRKDVPGSRPPGLRLRRASLLSRRAPERGAGRLDRGPLRIMSAIESCRTRLLGGHLYRLLGATEQIVSPKRIWSETNTGE